MEIDVTPLFCHEEYYPYYISNSRMELGNDASTVTWNNALDLADHIRLVRGKKARKAIIDSLSGYGAWTRSEMNGWTMRELNALVFQFITADMNEAMDNAGVKDWRYLSIDELFEVWPNESRIEEICSRENFPFYTLISDDGEKQIWYDGLTS